MFSTIIMHSHTHVIDVGLQRGAAHRHDIEHSSRDCDVAFEFTSGPVGGDFPAYGAFVEDGDPSAIAKLTGGERVSQRVERCAAQRFARERQIEPYGMLILIGLLFILSMLGAQLGVDLSIVSRVNASSTGAIIGAILRLTGNT